MSTMFASAPVALKAVVADRGASRRKSLPRVVTVRNSVAEGATKTSAAKTGDRQKAIVVGGGVGGLGMASRLAHAGYDVTILEKNEDTGGRARSEFFGPDADASGWRFDTGPSLMLLPDRYREQFTAVGKKLEDYMDIERVDPAYRAHFGDHTSLDLLYDTEKMRKQLDEVEFGAGGRYIDWLGRARASLDYGVAAFIERDANSILDFVDLSRVGPLALAVEARDLQFCSAMQPPGSGRNPIDCRLVALYACVGITFPSNACIDKIFMTIMRVRFQGFTEAVQEASIKLPGMTMQLHNVVQQSLPPTPLKIGRASCRERV